MFVPHWLYLGILLLLAIAVPLVIIRVLQRAFTSKRGRTGSGNRSCLVFGGFLLLFFAIGLSLAFYFPKTEIRTVGTDDTVSSQTVILYSPSEFVAAHHLPGFSFDSVYVVNESGDVMELRPQEGREGDTLSVAPGVVVAVAKTRVSAYNFDFAPQSHK